MWFQSTVLVLSLSGSGTALASGIIPEVGETGPTSRVPAPTTTGVPASATPAVLASKGKGVTWLLGAQHADGGWGAGNWSVAEEQASSDIATTAFVVLALLRDGQGVQKHEAALTKGVEHVVRSVEQSPKDGPLVTAIEGTQPQAKLGRTIDTHLAALMLGEVQGRFAPALDARVRVAYDKAIGKVQAAENGNGSFGTDGWAPVLSDTIASMSLNQAQAQGVPVSPAVIARADKRAEDSIGVTGAVDSSRGAGVELYSVASALKSTSEAESRGGASMAKKAEAAEGRVSQDASTLIQGFGSLGGEEMLSYMLISDTLAAKGGAEWTKWNATITEFLLATQNPNGSWAGHHCITSQTFTTAGALLTLAAGEGDATGARLGQLTGRQGAAAAP